MLNYVRRGGKRLKAIIWKRRWRNKQRQENKTMKKLMMILMIAIGVSSVAYGQTKMSKDAKIRSANHRARKSRLGGMENKDASWFQTNVTEITLDITSDGVFNKAYVVKSTQTDCDVKSSSLDNFKFVMLEQRCRLSKLSRRRRTACAAGKRFRHRFGRRSITSSAADNGSKRCIWKRRCPRQSRRDTKRARNFSLCVRRWKKNTATFTRCASATI